LDPGRVLSPFSLSSHPTQRQQCINEQPSSVVNNNLFSLPHPPPSNALLARREKTTAITTRVIDHSQIPTNRPTSKPNISSNLSTPTLSNHKQTISEVMAFILDNSRFIGKVALVSSSAFTGVALHVAMSEHPARLALQDTKSMLVHWRDR